MAHFFYATYIHTNMIQTLYTVNQIPVWKDNLSLYPIVYTSINFEVIINKVTKSVNYASIEEYENWILFTLQITNNSNLEDLSNGIIYLEEGEYEFRFKFSNDILFKELLKVGESINNNTVTGGYA